MLGQSPTTSSFAVASLLESQGRLSEAEPLYRRALLNAMTDDGARAEKAAGARQFAQDVAIEQSHEEFADLEFRFAI